MVDDGSKLSWAMRLLALVVAICTPWLIATDNARADPVEPGRFFYNVDFRVGFLVDAEFSGAWIYGDADDALKELHGCFSCSFPIPGAPRNFPTNGEHLPLKPCFAKLAIPPLCRDAPVKFFSDGKTGFHFVAEPGHLDGADSHITFTFYQSRADSILHLSVTGYVTHPDPRIPEAINKNQAFLSWQEFADHLGHNLYLHSCPRGRCP